MSDDGDTDIQDPFSGWDDVDHAIYDARVRRHLPWRAVGEDVGLSFSWAREKFYKALAKVKAAELDEYRTEENMKYDEREQHLFHMFVEARRLGPGGLLDATRAMREMNNISRQRRQLNGLDAPIRVDVTHTNDDELADHVGSLLDAYLQGRNDANTSDDRPSGGPAA